MVAKKLIVVLKVGLILEELIIRILLFLSEVLVVALL